MIVEPYIITQGDVDRGIEALAVKLLGSASLWTEIVQINNLGSPYMVSTAAEVLGQPASSWSLTAALQAGTSQITMNNLPLNITDLSIAGMGTAGLLAEVIAIAQYAGGVITLDSAMINTYPVGSVVQVFSSYILGNNNVLLPGSTVFIPAMIANNTLVMSGNASFVNAFGTDLANPLVFANGDISTVTGVQTLLQRCSICLKTQLKSYALHTEFGSKLYGSLGTPTNNVKWASIVRQALLELPELSNVIVKNVAVERDAVTLSAALYPTTSSSTITLYNEAFSLVP